ncbi:MAG: DUF4394 domain-containing protein [Steroidobacteraceae bacterium]
MFAVAVGLLPGTAATQTSVSAFELAALDTANSLVLFRSDAPQTTRTVPISGARGAMIGIDVRPMDGKLYGITDTGALHTIEPRTGAATLVSQLGSPFDGTTASGFDFNPQSDRLRLIAGTGQNLRVNVDVGAVAIDGTLSYAADDNHAGRRPQVAATAYTNSVARAPTTVTFDIDHALDILVRQEPPNDGVLATVGPLGIDCAETTGFDIATDARGADHAFLVCGAKLYRLDLESGAARMLGSIGAAQTRFIGLAVLAGAGAR